MQVLKDSKVKFVSAVGAHLLTSFLSVSAFLTAPGLIVLLLVGESGGGKPPSNFKPAKRVLQVLLDPAGPGCWAPCSPFLWFEYGGSLWAKKITGAKFPALVLRVLCGPHCPLCAYVPGLCL